jgi:hypothetical protein
MSAMEEAFTRARVQGWRGPARQPELPVVQPLRVNRADSPLKTQLAEDRVAFEAMTDDDLEFEFTQLTENVETIRAELRAWHAGDHAAHPEGWCRRAEIALAMTRGRLSLCRYERDRRQRFRETERKEQHAVWLEESMRRKAERKAANVAEADAKKAWSAQTFVSVATAMLPAETLAALWAAVDARRVTA